MIRISTYHWLPIADNMLPEIELTLRKGQTILVQDLTIDQDAISYTVIFTSSRDGKDATCFPVCGKINQRGFSQHILNIAPVTGMPINALLNELTPALQLFLEELLFTLMPIAVKNKLAMMHEGIVSYEQFQATPFDQQIDSAAKSFLHSCSLVSIMLDQQQTEAMRAGFSIPSLKLDIRPALPTTRAITNRAGTCMLFYSTEYRDDETQTLDGIIYKWGSLAAYVRFTARITTILKEARDHAIPLRQKLMQTLQGDTAEHFLQLTQMKKYLAYVNIKLPIVQKILNHLVVARDSDQFAAKVATFSEPAKVYIYPAIRAIETTRLQPHHLISQITEDSKRLQSLFEENSIEINVLSNEVSQVLEGSLLGESIQIWNRDLALAQSSLARNSQNHTTGLVPFASILLSAILGILLADMVVSPSTSIKLPIGLVSAAVAWLSMKFAFQRRRTCYRLVIPINATLPIQSLDALIAHQKLARSETNGTRCVRTWIEKFSTNAKHKSTRSVSSLIRQATNAYCKFTATIDYEQRGYVHSITLETEYNRQQFNTRQLVEQIVGKMANAGCLSEYDKETSLLVEIFSHLEIYLEPNIPALNRILTLPARELENILINDSNSSLSKDRQLAREILAHRNQIIAWLIDAQEEDSQLQTLLGKHNIQRKLNVIRTPEEQYGGSP